MPPMIGPRTLQSRLATLVATAVLIGASMGGIALWTLRGTISGYEDLLSTDVQDRSNSRREVRSVAAAADGHAATAEEMSAVTQAQHVSTATLAEAGQRMSSLALDLRATLDRFTHASPSPVPPAAPADRADRTCETPRATRRDRIAT